MWRKKEAQKPMILGLLLYQVFLGASRHTNELGSNDKKTSLLPQTPSKLLLLPCPEECSCSSTEESSLLDSGGVASHAQSVPPSPLKVVCTGRNITSIPDGIPVSVRILDLSSNNISWIDEAKLSELSHLRELYLNSNFIEEIGPSLTASLASLSNLRELQLSKNGLTSFPSAAIPPQLEVLYLEHNKITRLEGRLLPPNSKIHALRLGHNLIEEIDDSAFHGATSLQNLRLEGNRLTEIPSALKKLTSLQTLHLSNNRITRIHVPFHDIIPHINILELRGNPFALVHPQAFSHLHHLKTLILSDVKNLTEFPNLNGTGSVETLRIDRCSLASVPTNLCHLLPKLKSLDLKSNKLHHLPELEACSELRLLELSMNEIEDLREGAFANLTELHDLHLHHNHVTSLSPTTFEGLANLRNLDMSYNSIRTIHPDTFLTTPKLEDLNLGANFFPTMPTKGLGKVLDLKTFNNPHLKEFPGLESFPRVRKLVLSYAYHCCQFSASAMMMASSASSPGRGRRPGVTLNKQQQSSASSSHVEQSTIEESVLYPTDGGFRHALSELNLTDSWPGIANLSNRDELASDFWEAFGSVLPAESEDDDVSYRHHHSGLALPYEIKCIPLPGPFLPCNDLFDWWTLRCGVWIVFLLALMGNGTVVFVQVFARTKMDVPRFLVCNLAVADFFMGVYLGFLAVIDAATLGEFRKFAIPWQLSSACQIAGFLGVLSSELSVFTLTVITLERHYVITHAMHLNKRLSLKHAAYIMMIGWAFALLMAVLPLFGISDYRKFAVCLPFETGDSASLGYVVFLMFANGVAFTILMSCYVKMYCSIRGSAAWNSNETRIAKNMALLVFTDLLCWFPIAFFSLTAAFGLQLVSLEEAKVFTVFILPLNSCCNPFLYAILTKQFKKDCVLICKAIEESRVTRGIGRCRHSSNFSNRQTAPNTGSLTDKVSKDGQPCICNSGLHPGHGHGGVAGGADVNGNAKYHRFMPAPERLSRLGPFGRFFSRYVLCRDRNKAGSGQGREDPRMQNVRRYLYNTATANYPLEGAKHQRHPSVSSDNFSSSRSDSWRIQNRCGIPLRLLEPRRRNSWAVTRKPSQDSNLSSSRNDSSATSNSTATWRLSRSSVSSDANSHSGGGRSSFKKINHPPPSLPPVAPGHPPVTRGKAMPPPPLIPVVPPTSRSPNSQVIIEEESQQLASSPLILKPVPVLRRPSLPKTVSIEPQLITKLVSVKRKKGKNKKGKKMKRRVKKKPESDVIIIDDDEASAKIATNRPRLVRQSAFFSEEVIIEPEICPVHGPLNPGTYDDEDEEGEAVSGMEDDEDDDEDDEEEGDEDYYTVSNGIEAVSSGSRASRGVVPEMEESEDEGSSPTDPILKKQPQQQIGIALVIMPRRLSTISSRDTLSIRDETESFLNEPSTSTGGATSSSPRSSPTALLLPAGSAGFGRRKMSEQPVQFFVLPASQASGLLNSAKWHSMTSVETPNQATVQINNPSSPSSSSTHSRSQSPRGGRSQASSRMTPMAETEEASPLLNAVCRDCGGNTTVPPPESRSNNFGFRDPNERRVSFQLPLGIPEEASSTTDPPQPSTTAKSESGGNNANVSRSSDV